MAGMGASLRHSRSVFSRLSTGSWLPALPVMKPTVNPTPETLGVWDRLGCCCLCVLCLSLKVSAVPPVGAENLCHQAIFVNHAPGAVAPPDPELIQIRDAVGQLP